jgi:serine/threonine-protein kinase
MNQTMRGITLGQYELREPLGEGGMGSVYRGYQKNLKRDVAIKILSRELSNDPEFIARFNREAQTVAALEHPNIVPIHDYGTQQGISYVVMRSLTGGTLEDRLEERHHRGDPLPSLSDTAKLFTQIAGALDYAHEQGIVHRDLKPSNIMFDNHGNPFVVDFGIAKLVGQTTSITQSGGGQMGTPIYMAPEQWLNETVSSQTDQYAMGVIMYIMVTGQRPFDADTAYGLLHQHLNEEPAPVHEVAPNIPQSVTEVIQRAMSKTPSERYPTMTEFAEAFAKAIQSADAADMESTNFFTFNLPKRAKTTLAFPTAGGITIVEKSPPLHRNPFAWALAVALILVAVFAALFFTADNGSDGDNENALAPIDRTSTADAQIESRVVARANQTSTVRAMTSIFIAESTETAESENATASAEALMTVNAQSTEAAISAEETSTFIDAMTETAHTQATQAVIDEQMTQTSAAQASASARAVVMTQTAGAATATPRPTSTNTIIPTPTVRYPNGRRVTLFYNDSILFTYNRSQFSIPNESMSFEVIDNDNDTSNNGQPFEGTRWTSASTYPVLDRNRCNFIEVRSVSTNYKPQECDEVNSQQAVDEENAFWLSQSNTTEFRVLWNGSEVARCPAISNDTNELSCDVYFPRED